MEEQTLTTADVVRAYGLRSDELVLKFFKERGIKPLLERKHPRGVSRFWDRTEILRLHADFKAWSIQRRAPPTPPQEAKPEAHTTGQAAAGARNLTTFQRSYDTIIGALNDNAAQLRQINQKLDDLLAMWGSPPENDLANPARQLGAGGNGSDNLLGKFWRK